MAACGHVPLDLVPDGLHQVGLAHANAAIQEQRVVGLRGTLRDGLAGRMGELVAAADHEGVKGVARIELRCAIPVETRLRNASRRNGAAARSCEPKARRRDRTGVEAGSAQA